MTEMRINKLKKALNKTGLQGLALNPGPTMKYLTGLDFHLSERPTVVIITKDKEPAIILPEFEYHGIQEKIPGYKTFPYIDDPPTWKDAFVQAIDHLQLNGASIGLESNHMRVLELDYLQNAAPKTKFIAADEILNTLRMIKDEDELKMMREAVKIAQKAFEATISSIKVGVSEREVASELVMQLLKAGSDSQIPFQPIVASGPNGANPHATPGSRLLSPGDLVVIDWGAAYQGYTADITRTLAIGGISQEFQKIYDVVKRANQAGRLAAKINTIIGDVDKTARAIIEEAGFGEYFTTRTGHGLGLEVHETPYVFGANPLILDEGMTFTVEPGIYIPDRCGVRIEDNIVVRKNQGESLTDLSREIWTIY
ncbi:MAG: aminopeptidase P family protein [Anaerolineaceae bacterium]|nr:aminopeptidase P family protein [Anaerolineaceae bacterium]